MKIKVDHVTIAGSDLRAMERAYDAVGLPFAYGGPHSNGITHMSCLGLPDGSYVELISSMKPDELSPWWDAAIRNDGGPCAWAIKVDDVAAVARRVAALGIAVQGPHAMQRTRPDGKVIEWDLAFLGDGEAGSQLPFVIKDRTPRDWRVQPTPGIDPQLSGIVAVELAVTDAEPSINRFRRVFDLPAPVQARCDPLDAQLAWFAGTPITLAVSDRFEPRIALLGECPAAFVLGRPDNRPWFERDLGWLVDAQLAVVH